MLRPSQGMRRLVFPYSPLSISVFNRAPSLFPFSYYYRQETTLTSLRCVLANWRLGMPSMGVITIGIVASVILTLLWHPAIAHECLPRDLRIALAFVGDVIRLPVVDELSRK